MRLRGFAAKLTLVLASGAVVRLVLIALTPGEFYDTGAIARVGHAFLNAPLHVYDLNIHPGAYQGSPTYTWPYPPGFLPLAALLRWVAEHIAGSVSRLDRLLIAGVDIAAAWLVQWSLGRFGRPERERLQGAALIALGPTFIAVSGVHGQIDALAWLPAVAAVVLWSLPRARTRAPLCGALIGLGIAIKTTPGLVLLGLAPTARDRRELIQLLAAAAGVAVVITLPFALAAPRGLRAILDYRGFAGRAGLTLLLQPRLAIHQLTGPDVSYDATTTFLLNHATLILAGVLAVVSFRIWSRRFPPALAMVALLLAFYVSSAAVLPQYWLWIVPFLILAGRRRMALVYQLALIPLLVANYAFLQEPNQPERHLSTGLVLRGYVPLLWLVTLGLVVALLRLLWAGPGPEERR